MAAKGKQSGKRARVGRPAGPREKLRRNRVVAMVTDAELAKLDRMAEAKDLPLGTVVYEIVAQALRRRK